MNTKTAAIPLVLAVLAGCVTPPARRTVEVREPPRVYVYPQQGQSAAQMDRDRYECHVWATKQSGFDPSRHAMAASSRVRIEPAPSNQMVAAGAATGAVLGAVVADHGDAGKGAIIGAVAGGMLGAVAASSQEAEATRIEEQMNRRGRGRDNAQGAGYRRALTACLDGRGYSVN